MKTSKSLPFFSLVAVFFFFALIPSAGFGYVSENSRQGFEQNFTEPLPASKPSLSAFTAGFVAWDSETNVELRSWGNFRWPDKPGHGVKPCDDKDLPDWLDRLDFGRSMGFDHDPVHFGRHHGIRLTPYLFSGRRLDAFSGLYFNRWRQYASKYGRFVSTDPLLYGSREIPS